MSFFVVYTIRQVAAAADGTDLEANLQKNDLKQKAFEFTLLGSENVLQKFVCCKQCDQIWRFIGLLAIF